MSVGDTALEGDGDGLADGVGLAELYGDGLAELSVVAPLGRCRWISAKTSLSASL